MLEHAKPDELRLGLQKCLGFAHAWEGTFYRATTMEYANRHDLLTGIGSRKSGGRWNPPDLFNAVYGCLEPETAMAESLANYRELGIPVSKAMPLVFVAVTVKIQSVLDLLSPDVQHLLGVSTRRMVSTPWQKFQNQNTEAITQVFGRLAWESALEGILVPSSRRKEAINIVLFPSRRKRGSSWRIQRSRNLPPKPSGEI